MANVQNEIANYIDCTREEITMTTATEKFHTTKEFAGMIPCHVATLHKWRKQGKLAAHHVGERVFWYSDDQLAEARALLQRGARKTASIVDEQTVQEQSDPCAVYEQKNNAHCGAEVHKEKYPMEDDITPADEVQRRIDELGKFFSLLYRNAAPEQYTYLINFKQRELFAYEVADDEQRREMARRAVALSDRGLDIWHAVNLFGHKPTFANRGKGEDVSYQTAVIVDIDICSDAHKESNLAATFDEAKSFLPFEPSVIVNSGYGLHAYYIFDTPIKITNENREELKRRNNLLLDVIRQRAGGKKIDAVGDLPRILRTPSTCNYKLGAANAPMCHVVEDSGIRYTPSELDAKLAALQHVTALDFSTPQRTDTSADNHSDTPTKPARQSKRSVGNDTAFDIFRAQCMLQYISCAQMSYSDWLAVGMALKAVGCNVDDWEQWSRTDERFKEGECESKWQGFKTSGHTIGTLYFYASQNGYDPAQSYREWRALQPDTDTRPRTRDFVPDCPCNLIVPSEFTFGVDGIFHVVPTKKSERYICVARTPIVPIKKFRDPEKGNVAFAVSILTDEQWHDVEFEGATLADTRELAKILASKGALILDAKLLCRFLIDTLKDNSKKLPKFKSRNQTGWVNEDFSEFAAPTIGNYVIRREGYDFRKTFTPKGDADKWREKFSEVMEMGGAQARTVMGIAAASFLVQHLELPNLQAHVCGRRSIGKTPLLRFCVGAFGNTKFNSLSYTFGATSPKSRLELHSAYCDMPLIGEEIESLSKREAEYLPMDIYNFSLGIGGQVLKKDGTARAPKMFSGARLTSGETDITHQNGNGGELKRVLPLRCASLLDEDFASDLHGFCNRHHGHFLKTWTEYIIKNRDEIARDFKDAKKIAEGLQKLGREPKTDDTQLKTLIAGLVSYQHFKIAIGLQDSMNHGEIGADRKAIIATMPTADQIDDVSRALEFLKSFVASSTKYFWRTVTNPDTGRKQDVCHSTSDGYGKIFDSGEVAFFPHSLKMILQEKGGFKSADKLIAEFNDKGYLRSGKDGAKVAVWIDGRPQRVYRFCSDVIFSLETAESATVEATA